MKQLARASVTNDTERVSELSRLRISLKDEMRSAENEFNRLTKTWLGPDISKARSASDGISRYRHSLPPPRSLGQRALSIPFDSDHVNEEAHDQTTKRVECLSMSNDGYIDRISSTKTRGKRGFSLSRMRGSRGSFKLLDRHPSGSNKKDLRVAKSDIEAQLVRFISYNRDVLCLTPIISRQQLTLESSISKASSGEDIVELKRHRDELKNDLKSLAARVEEERNFVAPTETRRLSFHRISVRASRKASIEKEATFVKPLTKESIKPSELPVAHTDTIITKKGNLMKHPRRAQDKGLFGNLSLRGAQERWCEIDPSGVLKYYRRQEDLEPRGIFPIGDSTLEIVYDAVNTKSKAFTISVTTQQIRFQAKSRQDMLDWVHAFTTTNKVLTRPQTTNDEDSFDESARYSRDEMRATLDF